MNLLPFYFHFTSSNQIFHSEVNSWSKSLWLYRNKCLCSSPLKLLKGHVASCDVKAVCVCVTLRLRVSHECAWRGVRRWLGFVAAWGEKSAVETGSDSRYQELQTSPVIPQHPDGPVLSRNSAHKKLEFQLLRGLFDIFDKKLLSNCSFEWKTGIFVDTTVFYGIETFVRNQH